MISLDALVEDIVVYENQAELAATIERNVRESFAEAQEALTAHIDATIQAELEKAGLPPSKALAAEAKMLRDVLLDCMTSNELKSVDAEAAKVTLRTTVKAVPFKKDEWGEGDTEFTAARFADIQDLVKAGRVKFLDIVGGAALAKDFAEISAVIGHPLATVRIEESQTVVINKKK